MEAVTVDVRRLIVVFAADMAVVELSVELVLDDVLPLFGFAADTEDPTLAVAATFLAFERVFMPVDIDGAT